MTKVITADLIELDVELHNKFDVINYIVKKMDVLHRTTDKSKLLEDIFLREKEGPTSMGLGVAIPHAQTDSVTAPSVIFIRLKKDIDWNDDSNIRLIFGICVPTSNSDNQHLKILAKISRNLLNEDFRSQLLTANTSEECEKILNKIND